MANQTTSFNQGETVSKQNWNRVAFFALGTFLGGWVLGAIGGILGRKAG